MKAVEGIEYSKECFKGAPRVFQKSVRIRNAITKQKQTMVDSSTKDPGLGMKGFGEQKGVPESLSRE